MVEIVRNYKASTKPLNSMEQDHLRQAFERIHHRPFNGKPVELYQFQAEALYKEFCRLSNFATILGEPSPAQMAGLE